MRAIIEGSGIPVADWVEVKLEPRQRFAARQDFAAIRTAALLISGDLAFGQVFALTSVSCCNLWSDNSNDTWIC